jgi:hypothetical protein
LCRVPSEWQFAQAWILDNGEDELGALGGRDETLRFLHAHGFERITVKLQDGQTEVNQGIVLELNRRAGELGLPVRAGGWSQNRLQAHDDAEKANGLRLREGATFWIATTEFEYKGDRPPPGTTELTTAHECWLRMSAFLDRWAQIAAGFPLGIGYMPNEPRGESFDWGAVDRARARLCSECYPNEFPHAPGQWPDEAQDAVNARFGRQHRGAFHHPILGFHLPDGAVDVSADQYVESLRKAQQIGFTVGYSVYSLHHLDDADWRTLAAVNKPQGTPGALAWTS